MTETLLRAAQDGPVPLRCLDADHVALPFFDERHLSLALRLDHWLAEVEPDIETALAFGPKEAGRRLVHLLGRDGWLDAVCREPIDMRTISLIREGLAYRHDLLDFAFSIQAIAAAPILSWGTNEQKARFLPGLASGEMVGAFAVSEQGAGSNLAAAMLEAVQDGTGYRLTGQKNWIANADIADRLVVLARMAGTTGPIGLSTFVVDAPAPGLVPIPIEPIAPRSFGHLRFDGCSVPSDRLVGPAGAGLAIVLGTLERYRMSVGAAASGFARRALHEARTHASARAIGEERLIDLPVVRQKLADLAVALETARLTVARSAWEMDTGREDYGVRSSLAKLHATEAAQVVIDGCVQLHGAAGLVRGALPERLYREIRSLRIYEGTSEIQRMIVGDAVAHGFFG